jgi:uncharacterized protein YcaQ
MPGPARRVSARRASAAAVPTVPAAAARRFLLAGQGLLADPARRATPAAVYDRIERMGYVQVDTINVVARAHDHILFTRFDGYRPPVLARLLERDRRLFEHWTHDASLIPTAWFAHWKLRFRTLRRRMDGRPHWRHGMGRNRARLLREVRERIREEGPLMSRDFEHAGPRRPSHWWSGKPQKLALEYLWRAGELSVARRVGFQKVFDLTERVIPGAARVRASTPAEHLEWACREALERLGVATPGELSGYFDGIAAREAAAWCRSRAAAGEVVAVRVESVDGSRPRPAFAVADWEQRLRRAPDPPERTRLLSPFDPAVRDRARLRRLFGFDYRVEIFVPERQRRYGYFVLPVLEGERLVGRLEPRLRRDARVLEVRRLWWERGVRPTRARRRALVRALELLAEQVGAERVAMPRRVGGW